MPVRLELSPPQDAEAIATLRNAVADDLLARHGQGRWCGHCTARGVLFDRRHGQVYVVHRRGRIIASLTLVTKKPWAIDRAYFSKVARPLYLINMVVAPVHQRRGIGRACLEEAVKIARRFPADALFLDAYDHAAGAGEFYRKCGFRETGRVTYRTVPLIYYELSVTPAAGVPSRIAHRK